MSKEYSMDDLTQAEKELTEMLQKKKQLFKNLDSIEQSLYNLETSYIEDSTYGNIIRGYEGFLNSRTPNRRARTIDQDRIFSQSSVSFSKIQQEQDAIIDDEEEYIEKKKKKKTDSTRKKRVIHSDED
ncbi:hypothetical protein HK103_001404 [Boothiomyces macroporosus]|uniref:Chromatin modification-related protein EAF6 n=1 Tax=Boothiomyces macroporosus TaxID=261099 RepID=A0AAD5UAU7_9FUNG|nr:hypothetical protein HK103_001404 [Boothiomyces macroporosus]KAJ3314756.1 hypothetical protein HDV04_005762 [Boothiomyces sp. JEL0838]